MATLSLVAPALVIIMVIAKFLANFNENKTVQAAFYGIRPAVAALIGYAVWELVKIALTVPGENGVTAIDYLGALICIASFGVMQVKICKKLHPLVWIALGGVIGVLLKL